MKVCFLAPNFPPEVHAGTEMAVCALGKALRRRGADVVVVASSELPHEGEDVQREHCDDLTVLRIRKRPDEWDQGSLQRPRLLRLVDAVLAEERPDVVHAHTMSMFGTGYAPQALARGIPTVMTFHDLWVTCARFFRLPPDGIECPTDTDRGPCAPCVNRTLQIADVDEVLRMLHHRAEAIGVEAACARVLTAPSRTAARTIERCMPSPRPVEVVPHGLLADPAAFVRAAAPQPGERLRVGSFGNLVEQKGVLELVRAVQGADCELHLGGSFFGADFARQVRALAEELHVDLVYHGPYGPDSRHPAEFLHLAVFPSKCLETYGLVVDEALARGVPTVVSDRGALAERAATGGVVVASLPSLRAVVHDLVRDRGQLARLRAAVPRVLPTIDTAAVRYLELYEFARSHP